MHHTTLIWNLSHNSFCNTLDVLLLMQSSGEGSTSAWYQFRPILHGVPEKLQNDLTGCSNFENVVLSGVVFRIAFNSFLGHEHSPSEFGFVRGLR